MKNFHFFLFLGLFFCINCHYKNEKTINNSSKQTLSDTVKVSYANTRILIYSLSQKEYDKLNENDAYEYTEGYSDMIYELYSHEEYKNKIVETASRYLIINDSLIDKKSLNSKYGYIELLSKDNFVIN